MSETWTYPEPKNAQNPEDSLPLILVVGPIGTGKTTQYRTLKPIQKLGRQGKKFSYLFDPNAVQSLEGSDIDYLSFAPDKDDLSLAAKTLKKGVGDKDKKEHEPTTYVRFQEDFDARADSGYFDQYDWLGFDSITMLSEIIMDRVQFLNGRLGKHPEQADHTAEMNIMRNIFRKATNLGLGIYVVGHTELMKDELSGLITNQLVITGKNKIRLPGRFTQIYYLSADRDKDGRPKFTCQTVLDKRHPFVRTNIKGLDPDVDVTLDWGKELVGQGLGQFI